MGPILRGIATLTVIIGALIGLAAETTFIFASLAQSWTAMQTARAARSTRRSMAEINQDKLRIQTAEAAVALQAREAEAQELEQKNITATAEANAAAKIKTAEATIATVQANMTEAKLRYFVENQRAEMVSLYRNNSVLRYKVKACYNMYDDFEDASTHSAILIERPLKRAAR